VNDFEDRVRRGLRAEVRDVEADRLLGDVHRGASRRRRRRLVSAVAASVLVVAGAAGVATTIQGNDGTLPTPPSTQSPSSSPTATPSSTQPVLPDGATQGVVDVSVVSSDRRFRLTMNIGCVACSTVWQNEQSAEGGWERLHDFGTEAYAGKVNPAQGPVESIVMGVDGRDGWAWGQRLFATHDGGVTWNEVTTGPGQADGELGHQVALTPATGSAWLLVHTDRETQLWRTDVRSDSWERADAPDMSGVSTMVTISDYVLLQTSDEGLSAPRLQYFRFGDGLPWSEVANPCPGESQVHPAYSVAYMLCGSGETATIYRLIGVDHPVAGEQTFQWHEFGSSTGPVGAVHAIDDRRVLIIGPGGKAVLLTDSGDTVDAPATPTAVDLGLQPREETFSASMSSAGGDTYLVTSGGDLVASNDGGRTWHRDE
jgi:hypothetical protein